MSPVEQQSAANSDATAVAKPVHGPSKISKVVVHPLVLLSVVDHYNRVVKLSTGTQRVVGVLLGAMNRGGVLDISNSFAVPFEEDAQDKSVWFVDHDYLETMFNMFKKVNAREKVVGWYHSGPKLCQNDIAINELLRNYNSNSVMVIVDVTLNDNKGLPTEAYIAVDEIHDDGTPTSKTFDHLPSEIGAEHAEEVGVEHLLRDIKDTSIGSLSQKIATQLQGMQGMLLQLKEVHAYLEMVVTKSLPVNHQIIYQLQDMFNLLPDLSLHDFVKAMYVATNDQFLVVYLASLIRSILALHDLIKNKLTNREKERDESSSSSSAKKEGKKDETEKNKKDESCENEDLSSSPSATANSKSSNDKAGKKK